MFLKASIDYGLRMLLYLAKHDRVCSSKEISENMLIPRDYLIQLAQIERHAGLIESRPGKNGGYIISKPANEITLLEILNAINNGEDEMEEPKHDIASARHTNDEVTHMLDIVTSSYAAFLDSITLDMLSKCFDGTVNAEVYLADRLKEESQRLTQNLATA
ncbi:Rrf2 family transcriptional regulator [Adlercreutzia sp. ZJ304]|uniref:Rrf2 family transcriptional regulator n=1 Tax=Adlercreutzia sp. ZJ304 TaxID=2709791 RepID=UPI0024062B57|nr:Rrf2 family transcriptional regulator [Adlercreutzia sp. ZJ304]